MRGRSRVERERRAGRARRGAAIGVVGALAVGWFLTARVGNGDALAQGRDLAVAGAPAADAGGEPAWRARLPVGARCRDQDRSAGTARCTVAGIDVEYRRVRSRDADTMYRAAIGPPASRNLVQGPPACARGGEDERSWSRPDAPRRVAGRYACRVEQGRAAMWWTVADRGLLAHAIASDGDLGSLFAWWTSHAER